MTKGLAQNGLQTVRKQVRTALPSGGWGRGLRSLLQPGTRWVLVSMALRVGRCLCPLFLAGSWASCAEGQGRLWVLARVQALTHACLPQVLLVLRCYIIPEAVCPHHVCMCVCHVCLWCVVWLWGSHPAQHAQYHCALLGEAAVGCLGPLPLPSALAALCLRALPGESPVDFPSCTGIIRRGCLPPGPPAPGR